MDSNIIIENTNAVALEESQKIDLQTLFYPKSIAVIGASNKKESVGNDLVLNLSSGYKGKLYLVNVKEEVINDQPSYSSILKINDEIDMVVIAVPSAVVPQVLEEAGQKRVKAAVVISAGFKEAGRKDLEEQLISICKNYRISLIGPNCLGIINPEIKMNASFSAAMPQEGSVAFVSQSGALCTAVIDYAKYYGVGFSKFVSIGNKAVIDDVSLLEYLIADEKTKVIAMYIESLTKPHELINLMRKVHCEKQKPVIVIKSGRTRAGASASVSHTGALAGSDSAYDALFRQAGIMRAENVEELFDLVRVCTDNELSACDGVAVITNAGGPGVLATDELIASGLTMANFSQNTLACLKEILPPAANIHNPIDVLGDAQADRYAAALKIAVADENVQSILVILTPQSMTEINQTAQAIAEVKKTTAKPIVVTFMGEATVEAGVKLLQKENVAAVNFPEQAAKALAAMNKYASECQNLQNSEFKFDNIDKSKVEEIFKQANKKTFPEVEALKILNHYGFPLLKSCIVHSSQEAAEKASLVGEKIAMKIVSQDIIHKSDVGGVMLGIEPKNIEAKYDEMMIKVAKNMPSAKLEGALLMEMAPNDGFEFILGSSKDPALGNMIMVGLGGIFVEVLKDVSFGLAPINKIDARDMLDQIRSKKIFTGVRGLPALDTEALIDCLGRLSQLLTDFPEIKELDMNPLLVRSSGKGVLVLDGRIVLD